MKDKLLFLNTYKSRRSNGINRAYWTKYIKNILSENELEFLFPKNMDSYSDQMPIFSCLVKEKKRGLVIYQYNPSLIKQKEISYEKYLTAWVSQRVFHEQRIYILTICLIPSQKNIETSKNLIKAWFEKNKNVKRLIENIYESQNTP